MTLKRLKSQGKTDSSDSFSDGTLMKIDMLKTGACSRHFAHFITSAKSLYLGKEFNKTYMRSP
jgi:hypothetical protein